MTRKEIIDKICPEHNRYNCDDICCEDCDEQLNKWLDEYDNQIRADAIDDCVRIVRKIFTRYCCAVNCKEDCKNCEIGCMACAIIEQIQKGKENNA